jgi:lanosterol synthase
MNPSEMFGGCMVEQSYIECTASSLMALCELRRRYPDLLRQQIERAIHRARNFLMKAQNADGTWDAAWGVHYIYATMFGVRGLLAAGVPRIDPRIRKACGWVLARQRPDGGWGEHHSSCREGRYVSAPAGLCVQTAWALTTLVEANDPDHAAMNRAAEFLDRSQLPSGEWPNDEFTGVFFATALLNYRMYGQYFPVMALALWNRHLSKNE